LDPNRVLAGVHAVDEVPQDALAVDRQPCAGGPQPAGPAWVATVGLVEQAGCVDRSTEDGAGDAERGLACPGPAGRRLGRRAWLGVQLERRLRSFMERRAVPDGPPRAFDQADLRGGDAEHEVRGERAHPAPRFVKRHEVTRYAQTRG